MSDDLAERYDRHYGGPPPAIETIEDLRAYVGALREDFPEWRAGQTWFNALHRACPELAERIRGRAGLDPFYTDDNLRPLQSWLNIHWGDET